MDNSPNRTPGALGRARSKCDRSPCYGATAPCVRSSLSRAESISSQTPSAKPSLVSALCVASDPQCPKRLRPLGFFTTSGSCVLLRNILPEKISPIFHGKGLSLLYILSAFLFVAAAPFSLLGNQGCCPGSNCCSTNRKGSFW